MKSLFSIDYHPPQIENIPRPKGDRPLVTLSELIPRGYVDLTCRVLSSRASDKEDRLGSKVVFTGSVEDSTCRVPYLSHNLSLPLSKDVIMDVRSAYVHEFTDRSLLVIMTEFTRAQQRHDAELGAFIWRPLVSSIRRPILSVALHGILIRFSRSSGYVKRCNKCRSLVYDACPNNCKGGWSWDLRLSCSLFDRGSSIKSIFGRHLVASLVQRNLSALLAIPNAKSQQPAVSDQIIYLLDIPRNLSAIEAVLDSASRLRRTNHLVVLDGINVAFLPDDAILSNEVEEVSPRKLDPRDPHDSRILRRMIDLAIGLRLTKMTDRPITSGIHLLENPIALYSCERGKLLLGFKTGVLLREDRVEVGISPQALVRESVWDYVGWRRDRGATDRSVERALLYHRPNVIVDPNGVYGSIVEVKFRSAGQETISSSDPRTLPEFWEEVHGIKVGESEIPLLRIQLGDSNQLFTYPPSRVFFDSNYLLMTAGTRNFIEWKKEGLRFSAEKIVRQALSDLRIGSHRLSVTEVNSSNNFEEWMLSELHQKAQGREVTAQGRIVQLTDSLCFFPERIINLS